MTPEQENLDCLKVAEIKNEIQEFLKRRNKMTIEETNLNEQRDKLILNELQFIFCGFVSRTEKCENCGIQTKNGFTLCNASYEVKFVCSQTCGQIIVEKEGLVS
jgi:hypothetical protein